MHYCKGSDVCVCVCAGNLVNQGSDDVTQIKHKTHKIEMP